MEEFVRQSGSTVCGRSRASVVNLRKCINCYFNVKSTKEIRDYIILVNCNTTVTQL